ncbi:chymotrypsin inhibitor-like [Ceratina calcarata]|uniref:Chymotrypsin inhibitor-like n=1 Tax=Ceratina calcarata TaxID=156304 RepID=A0AAJ7JBS1_9HYME|nr:chymotrypsin inhibitor-like [Ceratina calcarata]
MFRSVVAFAFFAAMLVASEMETTAQEGVACPVNELWSPCARACEPTCIKPQQCYAKCRADSPGGCRCQDGYVRNPNSDQCVLLGEC